MKFRIMQIRGFSSKNNCTVMNLNDGSASIISLPESEFGHLVAGDELEIKIVPRKIKVKMWKWFIKNASGKISHTHYFHKTASDAETEIRHLKLASLERHAVIGGRDDKTMIEIEE